MAEGGRVMLYAKLLPALTGTPKQVAFANDIRIGVIRMIAAHASHDLREYLTDWHVTYRSHERDLPPKWQAIMDGLRKRTSAKWWCDRKAWVEAQSVNGADVFAALAGKRVA